MKKDRDEEKKGREKSRVKEREVSVLKRISKLWILGRKESFRFSFFFCRFKKKRLEANAIPSHTPDHPW